MAIGDLPQLGIVSYAGYVFNETTDTTLYRVSPRYDAARRTVTACEFTIALKWTIANNNGTAAEVRDMIARLTRSGEKLRYEGQVSVIVPLYNMNTLVAVGIGPTLLGEWQGVNAWRMLAGAALIVAGGRARGYVGEVNTLGARTGGCRGG